VALISVALLSGCATVPMASMEESNTAKEFKPPSEGNSGLYIYRDIGIGAALKKDILVDGKCIGETAQGVFFYEEVTGDESHTVSTESEFSPNDLSIDTASGENYFVEQYMKFGVFVGGANLQLVSEDKGKEVVTRLKMAVNGTCGTSTGNNNKTTLEKDVLTDQPLVARKEKGQFTRGGKGQLSIEELFATKKSIDNKYVFVRNPSHSISDAFGNSEESITIIPRSDGTYRWKYRYSYYVNSSAVFTVNKENGLEFKDYHGDCILKEYGDNRVYYKCRTASIHEENDKLNLHINNEAFGTLLPE
jgi:hypothetical protein